MDQRLRKHVEGLFEGTAPTKKAVELKEEMIQNLEDKYKDLIAEGKSPEAAANIAIAGIGDVSALIEEMEKGATMPNEAGRHKSAMLTAVAVAMYIVSFLPWIILDSLRIRNSGTLGFVITLLFVAGATGLLIYNSMTKPKYYKEDDTMVEEFREWQSDTHDQRQMRRAISSALWTVIVALFFILSFSTRMWHVTWIIFIIGGAIEAFINIFFLSRKK
ncbi:MAG: permease prefix domain 1-containing protein [Oscillospiraceae bacterium]|nr:permease prefix domain 1-containing protein [Oscillospiraceae bacterium]